MGMEKTSAKDDQYTGEINEKINMTIFLLSWF